MRHIQKPLEGEYDPYTIMYIKLVPDDGLVLQNLVDNFERVKAAIMPLSEAQLTTPHQDGEWTIKEILVHIMDDERIFAYRALRAARADQTPLPGFEQDDYIVPSQANDRSLESIFEEYHALRMATITLFKHLPDDALMRTITANNHPVSVRALVYHIAGHELHHLVSIQENYL